MYIYEINKLFKLYHNQESMESKIFIIGIYYLLHVTAGLTIFLY
jgi:hypothetical protein